MSTPNDVPDDVDCQVQKPPFTFEDAQGRSISICRYGDGPATDRQSERAALRSMYESFDPRDRAQGIPPSAPEKIDVWLDELITDDAIHLFAWDDTTIVGHATLVPDDESPPGYELAIFVNQSHQLAGIGSRLLRGLLAEAKAAGITQVWLTVERWNEPAIHLYRKVGFEVIDAQSFELEMAIELNG